MKAREMRDKTDSELGEMQRDLSRDLWNARFSNFTNQLDDTAKIGRLRREISRVITITAQRAVEGGAGASDSKAAAKPTKKIETKPAKKTKKKAAKD